MINEKSQLERRHVLYCDLLGFSNYSLSEFFDADRCFRLFRQLDRMVADASADIDSSVPDAQTGRLPDYVVKPEAIYFSDAIIISTPPTNVDAIWLCQAAAMIQNQICEHSFLVRGSIVTGEIYHSGNTIFGPAVAKAVALEKSGIPPVVVVSEETLRCFRHATSDQDREIVKIREYQLIAHEDSLLPFVDPFWLTQIHTNQPSIHERTRKNIESWRKLIEGGLKRSDSSVRQKYSWTARRFNLCLASKASAISPIAV
jgi:hypothetical protein